MQRPQGLAGHHARGCAEAWAHLRVAGILGVAAVVRALLAAMASAKQATTFLAMLRQAMTDMIKVQAWLPTC